MSLLAALLLDALFGEPRWLWSRAPHPAVLMGRAVSFLDQRLNHPGTRRLKGALATTCLAASAIALGFLLQAIPGQIIDIVLAAILLAHRSLIDHVSAVASGLRLSLGQGRRSVALIVSRDTGAMDASAVARSAIESAAENFSDGVVAPAFWFALFGLPGLLLYKVINTADSMIGYLSPRYVKFGWAAARLDDVLNFVPARLTALLIRATAPGTGGFAEIAADARLHRSPNAGWPEAALARANGIALAGPRSYDGQMRPFPFVNARGRRNLAASDIDAATRRLWSVWALVCLIAFLIALF